MVLEMEIEYLKKLRDYPAAYPNDTDYKDEISGISEVEITQLKQLYNNGNPFPKALKELLFLAGESCYVLAYLNNSQQAMRNYVRNQLQKRFLEIARPFFAIDVYNSSDQCLIVYLDEGEDPIVYSVFYDFQDYDPNDYPEVQFITPLKKLSAYINSGIEDVKNGFNPF